MNDSKNYLIGLALAIAFLAATNVRADILTNANLQTFGTA